MEQEPSFVGIDVSKAQVDVAVRPTGQRWVVSYDDTGVQELVSQMVDLGPALVLLEGTGGLELSLVAALVPVSYDDTGVQELVSQMVDLGPALVLLEGTGGLELSLVAALAAARWWWSTRARFETSPGPRECWPRPTPWTRRS